ncbi:FAD binding domain-containing protein [Schizothecium vesticola]|uniref:Fumarate reductase n=1 Tax=Schizothecium vesticola TaxID=314040 RepID=A0AA40F3J1_9PEZI|nr:FAD binding domain-containing protein [Schizothecium vesticola]
MRLTRRLLLLSTTILLLLLLKTIMLPPTPKTPAVIIIGSGLAGLSAGLTALTTIPPLPHIYLLDAAPKPGGNSIKASSGINAAPSPAQQPAFYTDTVRSAGHILDSAPPRARQARESLIRTLTARSAGALQWLTSLGVDLSVVAQLGGHSEARTHRPAGGTPPGWAIVKALLDRVKAEDKRFAMMLGCRVTRLLADSGGVRGVEYVGPDGGTEELYGSVVFATGGFAGDTDGLLKKYRPDLEGMPSTNEARVGAHGVLTAVGARLVDMESVQVHPTGFVDPARAGERVKILAAEMLRGEGGVLMYKGKRFVNELDTRERVSKAIMELPAMDDKGGEGALRQWDVQILLDAGAAEAAKGHVGFYTMKGLLKKVKVAALDATTQETVREYGAAVEAGDVENLVLLGRKAFGHWKLRAPARDESGALKWDEDAEVLVGTVTPITHFTMGGVAFNTKAQVLASDYDEEEKPIPGLWAAGEITGGIHGDNRLGGSSLLECVVFGRIAGEEAAKAAMKGE